MQTALDAYIALADKAGDASAVTAANKAAAELIPVSQQWFVGQFWGDPKLKDAIAAAMKAQTRGPGRAERDRGDQGGAPEPGEHDRRLEEG